MALLVILFVLFPVICQWVVFSKAGEPGWACIIPIYNVIVLLRIAGKPLCWILMFLIPVVNVVFVVMTVNSIAKSFGKDVLFTLGLILLPFIFWGILAFGDAEYQGIEE